jgi:hypothetical protein
MHTFPEYTNMLPTYTQFSDMPTLLKDHEQVLKFDQQLLKKANRRREQMSKEYKLLIKEFKRLGLSIPSKREFIRARLCVETRCVATKIPSLPGVSLSVVPLFDMINHSQDGIPDCKIVKVTSNCGHSNYVLELRAHKDFKAGEEVFIRYGQYSNIELYLNYGFVIEDNPIDSICLDGVLQVHEHYLKEKFNSFKNLDLKLHEIYQLELDQNSYYQRGEYYPWKLVTLLRILALSDNLSDQNSIHSAAQKIYCGSQSYFDEYSEGYVHEALLKILSEKIVLIDSIRSDFMKIPSTLQMLLNSSLKLLESARNIHTKRSKQQEE